MTLEEAARSANTEFLLPPQRNPRCFYVRPKSGPQGVAFMVTDDHLSRVDVSDARFRTGSGARIGSTEQEVMALYPGQIEVTPHPYLRTGHYLTFKPTSASDASYRVIFETDGTRVTGMRSGKMPEVDFTEGCS